MKSYSDEAMAEIIAGTAITVGAVDILCDPPLYVWGGPWNLTVDGKEYLGVGDRGLVGKDGAGIGNVAAPLTLELSGVDPATIELLDADEVRGATVVLRQWIFDGAGQTLLENDPVRRGRLDQLTSEETPGGTATISALIEGAARGLGRRSGRMRSDADQRLVEPTDGGFKHISYAAQKMLYWSGKPPARAGAAVGGVTGGGGIGAFVLGLQER